MKKITASDLRRMKDKEGLILQGCGGDLKEWVDGVNELLTEAGILKNGSSFSDVYVFENEGLTNLLFSFDNVNVDIGKLVMWRIATHYQFGGTWLSDYIDNKLSMGGQNSDYNFFGQAADIDEDDPELNM